MKIIELQNICVSYDEYDALKNISFNICKNEHTLIFGANGCGKSTLIKLLSNDIYPRILPNSYKKLFGKEVWNIFELKQNLGIITGDMSYQLTMLAPYINVFEAVISSIHSAIGIQDHHFYTKDDYSKTDDILKMIGIFHLKNKNICTLSTGELRKTVIARALMHNPSTLLLDEPTTGLDIKSQYDFLALIKELAKTKTIILITHHIEEIIPEIKKVVMLKNGEIFKIGTKEEIITSKNLSQLFNTNIEIKKQNDRFYIKNIF